MMGRIRFFPEKLNWMGEEERKEHKEALQTASHKQPLFEKRYQ